MNIPHITKPYKMFLSSFSSEKPNGNPTDKLHNLREDIFLLGEKLGKPVWVAEYDKIDSPQISEYLDQNDHMGIIDLLSERISESEQFICILAGSRKGTLEHGSPLQVDSLPSAVSHFEIEIIQAAMKGLFVKLFILEGFDPGIRLQNLLRLLGFALPGWQNKKMQTPKEILSEIECLLNDKRSTTHHPEANILVSSLYSANKYRTSKDPLLFMGGFVESRNNKPNLNLIQTVLEEQEACPEMSRKLSRLWVAYRELMSSDYRIETNPDYLRIWEQIIRQWNGAASWNGLIAHIQGGVFAALGSLEIIREKLRKLLNADFPEDVIKRPLGAYASANYSLAKRMVHKHDRKHVLETALRYANETIEDQKDKETGIYAVRGSIYLRQRKPFAATRDFKRTVKHYESLANGNSGLGHAYLNLGTAYCFSGRLLKGQEFLIRGHQILSKDENGPHIQSLRRLAKFYKLTGRKTKSEGYRNQAVRLAEKLHMYDQLRQIQAD